MEVTEAELARALRTTKIIVHDQDGLSDLAGCISGNTLVTRAKGRVWLPEDHAAMLLKRIADDQAERAVEIAECRAEGARCDRVGGPCTCPIPYGDVVDAHICCEHADGPGPFSDPELAAMAHVIAAMEPLDQHTRQRIRMWVDERWAVPRA